MSETRRCVFFNATLMQGGAERVVSIISHELAEQPLYKVTIILWYDKPIFYDIDSRVEIISIPKVGGTDNFLKKLLWLRKYFRKEKGVIISFLAPFNIVALVCHMGIKTPIVVADRNDPRKIPKQRIVRWLRNLLYRYADLVILQTKSNSEYFYRIEEKKKEIIPNPVLIGNMGGLALRTTKKKRIVTVGRLVPQKNHELLIRAFSNLSSIYPEYVLALYGDGPLRSSLQDLVERLGINSRVIFMGNVKNVFEDISNAEMFVLSSNFEGMPNALMEAMCLGLPVISTKVSGAIELINQYNAGLLVDIGDCAGLENAMKKLIEDDSYRETISKNAAKLVESVNPQTIANKWISSIESLG